MNKTNTVFVMYCWTLVCHLWHPFHRFASTGLSERSLTHSLTHFIGIHLLLVTAVLLGNTYLPVEGLWFNLRHLCQPLQGTMEPSCLTPQRATVSQPKQLRSRQTKATTPYKAASCVTLIRKWAINRERWSPKICVAQLKGNCRRCYSHQAEISGRAGRSESRAQALGKEAQYLIKCTW